MKNFYFLFYLLYVSTFSFDVTAQPGVLDPTFNFSDLGFGIGDGANATVQTSVLQSDGKIIIAGDFTSYNGIAVNRIVRLNIDGSIDGTFKIGAGANNSVSKIALQSDGKIIIVGHFTSFNGTATNRIARLNSDGSLDGSLNPGLGANSAILTIAVQPDDKILIGGLFTAYNGTLLNYITRLNSDGSLDGSFNIGIGANDYVMTITIQNDGKSIIGGYFTSYNGIGLNRISRLNSDGSLDGTFTIGAGANNTVFTCAIQSDGKIIIGGRFNSFNGTPSNCIARLNIDGSLDGTFNIGTGANNDVLTTVIQSDGKILIGGDFTTYDGAANSHFARLNSTGSLDATFNPSSGLNYYVNNIVIQSNGKILIGGLFYTFNGVAINNIACLNPDGTIDSTFNPGSGSSGIVRCSAIQSDGKIIIGGQFTSYNGIINNRIMRLNLDGSLDASFNTGSGSSSAVFAIAIQSDGKIIIGCGETYNGIASRFIARLNVDGSLDGTFNIGTGVGHYVRAIAVQNDQKIIIVGDFTSYNGTPRNRVARLNSDGSLDGTFNPGAGANGFAYACSIQSDGKILIGGDFTTYDGIVANRIARLNSDGSLDATFTIGSGANGICYTSTIQSDGKILIAGDFTNVNGTLSNRIARLNSDGSVDGSFNSGTGANNYIWTTSIQSDGKIIIGGNFTSYNGTTLNNIARLNSDGSIDYMFNPGTGASNIVFTSSIQNDGKIIFGGYFTSYNGIGKNRLGRLLGGDCLIINTASAPISTPTLCINTMLSNITHTTTGATGIGVATGLPDGILASWSLDMITISGIPTEGGTFNYSIPLIGGCGMANATGSIKVNTNSIGIDIQVACGSYKWMDGNTYTSNNTSATHILTNAAGCDSVVTLNLTINTVDISLTSSSPTLTANATGATYQWLNCDNAYSILSGKNSPEFTATINGSYAVEITENGCVDTSLCTAIVVLATIENSFERSFVIHPNPTTGKLIIELLENNSSVEAKLINGQGQVVSTEVFTNTNLLNIEINGDSGYYYLELHTTNEGSARIKVLKE